MNYQPRKPQRLVGAETREREREVIAQIEAMKHDKPKDGCPQCGSTAYVREAGCAHCLACGFSLCK